MDYGYSRHLFTVQTPTQLEALLRREKVSASLLHCCLHDLFPWASLPWKDGNLMASGGSVVLYCTVPYLQHLPLSGGSSVVTDAIR